MFRFGWLQKLLFGQVVIPLILYRSLPLLRHCGFSAETKQIGDKTSVKCTK
jgi:hypothetical protein